MNKILLQCDCGCCIWEFLLMDDAVFVSVYGNLFYEWQSQIRRRLHWGMERLNGKGPVISSICLSRSDIEDFLRRARAFEFTQGDDEYENRSHIEPHLIPMGDPADDLMELSLITDRVFKVYRSYDLSFRETEWSEFLATIERELGDETAVLG